jgi:hypothetical protein
VSFALGKSASGASIDEDRVDGFSVGVDENDLSVLMLDVFVAPRVQRDDDRAEFTAALGGDVLESRWPITVPTTLEQPGFDERFQPAGQHVRCDAEVVLELVEPGEAVEGVAQNQERPPLADLFERGRDRTPHRVESVALHRLCLGLTSEG